MKKTLSTAGKCLICWAAVLAVCFGLLCAAAAVPSDMLRSHLDASAEKLAGRDPHGMTVKGLYNSVCDNYADAVLLGIAANMHDVRSAVGSGYYCDDFGPALGIKATLAGYEPNTDYSRYWHGSLVFIRPLLAAADIDGIRMISAAVLIILFVLDCVLLMKRNRAAGVIFIAAAVLTHIWFACTTLEYMTVYIIMLGIMPLYLRYAENDAALVIISAAAGTVTAFADFLTTEIMTLFIPLTAVIIIRAKRTEKQNTLLAGGCSASWLGAYALTFIVKWAAASSVTGMSISDTALTSAGERLGGLPDGISSRPQLLISSLSANLTMLTPSAEKTNTAGIVIWLFLFAAACVFIAARDNRRCTAPKVLTAITVIPLIRYCVLMNHSYLHNFFTYRALMISIMAVLALVWYKEPEGKKKKTRH